jgi:hypothetical protein
LQQVGGFLMVFRFPPPKKTDRHDIAEILVKVALNTFNQTDFQPDKPIEIDIELLSYFIASIVNRHSISEFYAN